jgi:hypothetical protein
MLQMQYKKFNQELHDICDPPAREAVATWLENLWYVDAQPNPDKYAVDLVLSKNGEHIGYAEVEVRDWGMNFCPYDTIHIAQRKEKLFAHPRTTMYVVTKEYTHAYWIKAHKIKDCPLIEVPNKAVSRGEYFYDVPKNMWNFVDLREVF